MLKNLETLFKITIKYNLNYISVYTSLLHIKQLVNNVSHVQQLDILCVSSLVFLIGLIVW